MGVVAKMDIFKHQRLYLILSTLWQQWLFHELPTFEDLDVDNIQSKKYMYAQNQFHPY